MPTCVLLSVVSCGGSTQAKSVVEDDKPAEAQPSRPSPGATRLAGKTLLGAFGFLNIFEAAKVALLANPLQVGSAQAFTATPFSKFEQIVEEL